MLGPGLLLHMAGDQLQALVENPHQSAIPTGPDLSAQVLRRHRVEGPVHLDMAVPMDPSAALVKVGKTLQGQRPKSKTFHLRKDLADLLAGGPMQPRVGHVLLPIGQELVLKDQAGERSSLEGVILDVIDAAFNFALVPGHIGARGPEGQTIMLSESPDFGVDVRVVPIRVLNGGLEVIQNQSPWHTSEIPPGVLQTLQEAVRALPPDDLTVGLARVAQDNAEDVRSTAMSLAVNHPGAPTKIDLGFFAWAAFQTAEGQGSSGLEIMDETADTGITRGEAVFGHQVLVDPLRGQTQFQLGQNDFAKGFTLTGLSWAAGLKS